MIACLVMHHRMMVKIRDDSKPIFIRFSLLKALKTPELYGFVVMLHLAGAIFIALKIVEGHTIIEFFPLRQ
jgi:hypothetical protein